MLCVLVNIRFQVLFHSPPGVLFTFPSQYCSTIGHRVVFRLGGWSPHVLIGFHVSDDTLDTASPSHNFAYETFTPFGWPSQIIRLSFEVTRRGPNPWSISTSGLASSAFARHYSQNLVWFLFLPLLRCFSSGGSPHHAIWFTWCSVILHHRCSHIRKSAGHSLFAAHRSLSQLVTSFFGSQCQGILHILFFAWTTLSKLLVYFLVLRFFSRLNCCVSYLQLQDLVFIFVWQNCFNFYPYGKNLISIKLIS